MKTSHAQQSEPGYSGPLHFPNKRHKGYEEVPLYGPCEVCSFAQSFYVRATHLHMGSYLCKSHYESLRRM